MSANQTAASQATTGHGSDGTTAGDGNDGADGAATFDVAGGLEPDRNRRTHYWYRSALAVTVFLVVLVILALPFALQSMMLTLFAPAAGATYDLESGQQITVAETDGDASDTAYFNIALTGIDPGSGTATMTVSGHRECAGDCPELDILLLSLDDHGGRRGMAPSADIEISGAITTFTETITLPVSGNPSLYPFDDYRLMLALAGFATLADGTTVPITPELVTSRAVVSVQNQVPNFVMQEPRTMRLPKVEDDNSIVTAAAGQDLTFTRPAYLKILTALLAVLIAISGTLALFTRTFSDLLLSIGGLILGVWGVRSVMVPQPIPTLSLVDMALSGVILFMLIALAIRAAAHFHHHSELPRIQFGRGR